MKENVFREYLKYMLLNVLGMLGLSCYILADTYFVSAGLGNRGLTALNLAIPVYSFIHGTGLMLGMGGATRYSMLKSQEQEKRKNLVFSNTVMLYAVFSVLYVFTGIFCADQITVLLGADEAVFSMTRAYLKTLLQFSPAFLLNETLLCFVRNDGAPQLSMAAMLGGSFSNIILDYVFIFIFDMGIFGAVLATCFAPLISIGILSPFFIKKKNQFHFVRCRMERRTVGYIFSSGIPSLIAELSSGIVMIVFNGIILGIQGNIGVAAYGVIANLSLVVIAVYTGIAQGIQPIVSRDYGSGNRKNTGKVFRYAVYTVLLLSAVIYLGMFFGTEAVTAIFNSEGNLELQKMAEEGLKLYFTACPFAGFNIILSVYFTSTDKAKPANMISILRGFVIIVPMAFLMAAAGKMTGLWMAFPVTEFLVVLSGVWCLFQIGKR